jgi:small GTP-binding protein
MSRTAQRIKLGIVGQSGVGKTHFLQSFLSSNAPTRRIDPTVAVEFYERITMVDQQEVALRIWDTSGEPKYKPIVGYHLRECQVIILMYDLTDFDSKVSITQALTNYKTGLPCSGRKDSNPPTRSCS